MSSLSLRDSVEAARVIGAGVVERTRGDRAIRRLATGLVAPRAADGPSVAVGHTVLTSRIRSLEKALTHAQAGRGLIDLAESALGRVTDLVAQLRELALRAANLPGDDAIRSLQAEADRLVDSIDSIAASTRYARSAVFDGSLGRTVELLPAQTNAIVGAIVPPGSDIPDGVYDLVMNQTGIVVSTDVTTSSLGEFGRITDPPTAKSNPRIENTFFLFDDVGVPRARDATGLGGSIAITAGFTNPTNVRFGPDGSQVLFEADNTLVPGRRMIYSVPRTGGAATTIGFGSESLDFDTTAPGIAPGTQFAAFRATIFGNPLSSFAAPHGNDHGLAANPFTGTLFVADRPTSTIQEMTFAGAPIGGPVAVPFMTQISGLTVHTGTGNFFGVDPVTRTAHEFQIVAGVAIPVNAFSIAAAVAPGALSHVVPGALDITVQTAVDNPANVPVPETITLSFTEAVGVTPVQFSVTGSVSGVVATGQTLTSGVEIQTQGIDFTLTGRGASRGLTAATTTTVAGVNDQLVVSVNGAPGVLVTLGNQITGGGIAAAIQAQMVAAGFPTFTASFTPGSRYVLRSGTVGAGSSVTVTAGPADASSFLRLGVANGGIEALNAAVLTGDTFTYTVTRAGANPTGVALDGAGSLRISDATTNRIYQFSTAGAQAAGGLTGPGTTLSDVAFHAARGTLFVAEGTANFIREINAATGTVVGVHTSPLPGNPIDGLTVNAATGNFFSVDTAGDMVYEQNPAAAVATNLIMTRNLVTTGIATLANEAGTKTAPRISADGTTVVYLNGGNLFRRPLGGGAATQITFLGTATSPTVSPNGGSATFQSLGTTFAVDTTGAGVPFAIGSNPQFNPASSRIFYESAGNVFSVASTGGPATQLTGVGPIPAGGNFSLSPSGAQIAYVSGAHVLVINSDGSSLAPIQITNQPGIPPGGGSAPTWSRDGTRVGFVGPDGQIWIRFATGTPLSPIPSGGFFLAGPSVLSANTLVEEGFTLQVVTDLDGADIFSVTGNISGAHAVASAGSAYVTNPGFLGQGSGLSFTIRQSGQYAVGDRFFVNTSLGAIASLAGGAAVPILPNSNFLAFTPTGDSLQFFVGSPIPGPRRIQPVQVGPGVEVQVQTEEGKADRVRFSIERLDADALGLDDLDLEEPYGPRAVEPELRSAGLALTSAPRVVDDKKVPGDERITVGFLSPTSFVVTGSVSGVLLESGAYTSGVPINVAGVRFTLTGAASVADQFTYEVRSTGLALEGALERVLELRGTLGAKAQEILDATRIGERVLAELTDADSELADSDTAVQIAERVRGEILGDVHAQLLRRLGIVKGSLVSLLSANLTDVLAGG